MSLHKLPISVITFNGRQYKCNLSFNRVLLAADILNDKTLPADVAAETALEIFGCKNCNSTELLEKIFDILTPKKENKENKEKILDFEQDADYIYAAFWQAYNIDLDKQHDKLHWSRFMALLNSLPENTRMSQIIDIRTKPMPKPTKYNVEERAALSKAKARFALHENIKNNKNEVLWNIYKMLAAQAGR